MNIELITGRENKKAGYSIYTSALRSGALNRPSECSVCGKKCKPHGHHTDYSKPLDVKWLCRKCHADAHRRDMLLRDSQPSARPVLVFFWETGIGIEELGRKINADTGKIIDWLSGDAEPSRLMKKRMRFLLEGR